MVRGDPDAVARLAKEGGLMSESASFTMDDRGEFLGRAVGVAEVVIPPRSAMVGVPVFPGMVTDSGDLVILAVQRKGEDLGPKVSALAVGDTLLVQGQWEALDHHVASDPEVLVVDAPEDIRRQAVPMGPHSREAIAIVAAMVALLATGAVQCPRLSPVCSPRVRWSCTACSRWSRPTGGSRGRPWCWWAP